MTKLDTYHRQPLGADGLDGWEQINFLVFVEARADRVSGHDWAFETETHQYWAEGS
jgi:hypothetical protein